MGKYASEAVKLIQSWVGIKEGSSGHKEILAIYNSQKPLPRGYKMTTKDAWCAATTTAVAVKLGYTDIIPCECSCTKLIEKAKAMGIWVENESVTPKPGWLCIYDWQDNGRGDNKGAPEHVGMVEKVSGGQFVVIEGNYSNSVKRRPLEVNGRYIRGFIAPKYDAEVVQPKPVEEKEEVCSVNIKVLKKGAKGNEVKSLQILLNGYGYSCGSSGADGSFGPATDKALRAYQKAKGLTVDGVCGPATWSKLLGVK
jgi:hypothetical protein